MKTRIAAMWTILATLSPGSAYANFYTCQASADFDGTRLNYLATAWDSDSGEIATIPIGDLPHTPQAFLCGKVGGTISCVLQESSAVAQHPAVYVPDLQGQSIELTSNAAGNSAISYALKCQQPGSLNPGDVRLDQRAASGIPDADAAAAHYIIRLAILAWEESHSLRPSTLASYLKRCSSELTEIAFVTASRHNSV